MQVHLKRYRSGFLKTASGHHLETSRKESTLSGRICRRFPGLSRVYCHSEAKGTSLFCTDRIDTTVTQEIKTNLLCFKYVLNALIDQSCHLGPYTATYANTTLFCQMGTHVSNLRHFNFSYSDLIDNCIGINNRRYYILLCTIMSLLTVLTIYPLSLLGHLSSPWRAVAMVQLLEAFLGSIGLIFYTGYLWYTCLHGLYRVDFESQTSPDSNSQIPQFLTNKENMWVTFGTDSWVRIIGDTLCLSFFKRVVN